MRKRLESKLWKESEINRAQRILSRAGRHRHRDIRIIEEGMAWFTAALGVLASIAVSILIIPVLVAGNNYHAAFISLLFGVLVGLLLAYISVRMHWMHKKHNMIIALTVAASGLISLYFAASLANKFNTTTGSLLVHDPLILAFLYFLGYLTPYSALTIFGALKRWND
jgi:hypothetical protein